MREVETAQTFLTEVEVERLVADYAAGSSVKYLAERYEIHRATVFRHLRRHNTPLRGRGLDTAEKAEAVHLFRSGIAVRTTSSTMGVGRKSVRSALVEVGVTDEDLRLSKVRKKVVA